MGSGSKVAPKPKGWVHVCFGGLEVASGCAVIFENFQSGVSRRSLEANPDFGKWFKSWGELLLSHL